MTQNAGACVLGAIMTAGLLAIPSALVGGPSDPNRIRLIALVFVHVTWCIVESVSAGTDRRLTPGSSRERWLPPSIAGAMLLVTALAAVRVAAPSAGDAHATIAACLLGAGVAAVGIVLRSLAIRRLGPRFLDAVAIGASGHTLERSGVFARSRHPAELGFLLILLGTGIISGSGPALVAWLLVVVPLVIYRTRLEDRLLVTRFGADAVAYQATVPAFAVTLPPRSGEGSCTKGARVPDEEMTDKIVELITSEGCSSRQPAERIANGLGQPARRDRAPAHVIATDRLRSEAPIVDGVRLVTPLAR